MSKFVIFAITNQSRFGGDFFKMRFELDYSTTSTAEDVT